MQRRPLVAERSEAVELRTVGGAGQQRGQGLRQRVHHQVGRVDLRPERERVDRLLGRVIMVSWLHKVMAPGCQPHADHQEND